MSKEYPDGAQVWIIYDERGQQDTEIAAVLVTCDTIQEVCSYKPVFSDHSAVYRYMFKGGIADDETYMGRLKDQ